MNLTKKRLKKTIQEELVKEVRALSRFQHGAFASNRKKSINLSNDEAIKILVDMFGNDGKAFLQMLVKEIGTMDVIKEILKALEYSVNEMGLSFLLMRFNSNLRDFLKELSKKDPEIFNYAKQIAQEVNTRDVQYYQDTFKSNKVPMAEKKNK